VRVQRAADVEHQGVAKAVAVGVLESSGLHIPAIAAS
jgi:hypothetical protein